MQLLHSDDGDDDDNDNESEALVVIKWVRVEDRIKEVFLQSHFQATLKIQFRTQVA